MNSCNEPTPVLKIANGLIQGSKGKTIYDDEYYGYQGIPFAQPPLGDLRFKAPKAAQNWEGIRDCRQSNISPLQRSADKEIEGTEDCLYINVYTKTLNIKENLPVMVFTYGGGFVAGSCIPSEYGPDYLMHENVILVTFNYRVSVLGFLSFEDATLNIPGNAGLKDQILALEWVRDNISFFGGNKDNVTLFGESAGAASVHYMMCTEKTKGLFHKAICMSGCILNNWALDVKSTVLPYLLANSHGYIGPKDDRIVFNFLQSLAPSELLNIDRLNEEVRYYGGYYTFLPCIEPYESESAIIRKQPLELLKTSWANEIPLIIGGTSFEGLIRYRIIKDNPGSIKAIKKVPERMLPSVLLVDKSHDEKLSMLQKIVKLHFKENDENQKAEILAYLNHASFYGFWHDIHRVVKYRKLNSTADTYQYLFDFDSPTFNTYRTKFCGSDIEKGVSHADDLCYLFFSSDSEKVERDSREYLTLRRMVKMWTQFAKTSNPNCEYTKDSEWKTVNETSDMEWMRITSDLKFDEMDEDFMKTICVWDSLYGKRLL